MQLHQALDTMQEMQAFYRQIHEAEGRDITPNLPTCYPTSVLIGCVDVVACVPVSFLNTLKCQHADQLWQLHKLITFQATDMEAWGALPDTIKQEIGSPFCFLCEKPKRLVVPQQMRGYPKLWQLPSKTATTLTTALKAPPDPVPFSWAQFGKPDTHDAKADEPSSRSRMWYDKYGKAKEQARKL